MTRLSEKQRRVLGMIADACAPTHTYADDEPHVVPFYVERLGWVMFDSESERSRFLERLEARGLIRVERNSFAYITEAGTAALSSNMK